jgi:hypothetical protein
MNFETVLKETREAARKSDLANLSHALLSVEGLERDAKVEYEKRLEYLSKLKAEIVNLASQDNPDSNEVKEVYNKACGRSRFQ